MDAARRAGPRSYARSRWRTPIAQSGHDVVGAAQARARALGAHRHQGGQRHRGAAHRRAGAVATHARAGGSAREEDFDTIMGLVGIGRVEALDGRTGRFLQARPKAAHGRVPPTARKASPSRRSAGFTCARSSGAILRDPAALPATRRRAMGRAGLGRDHDDDREPSPPGRSAATAPSSSTQRRRPGSSSRSATIFRVIRARLEKARRRSCRSSTHTSITWAPRPACSAPGRRARAHPRADRFLYELLPCRPRCSARGLPEVSRPRAQANRSASSCDFSYRASLAVRRASLKAMRKQARSRPAQWPPFRGKAEATRAPAAPGSRVASARLCPERARKRRAS